jgi:hypothetical protein
MLRNRVTALKETNALAYLMIGLYRGMMVPDGIETAKSLRNPDDVLVFVYTFGTGRFHGKLP